MPRVVVGDHDVGERIRASLWPWFRCWHLDVVGAWIEPANLAEARATVSQGATVENEPARLVAHSRLHTPMSTSSGSSMSSVAAHTPASARSGERSPSYPAVENC